jgi:hypothetical protein
VAVVPHKVLAARFFARPDVGLMLVWPELLVRHGMCCESVRPGPGGRLWN